MYSATQLTRKMHTLATDLQHRLIYDKNEEEEIRLNTSSQDWLLVRNTVIYDNNEEEENRLNTSSQDWLLVRNRVIYDKNEEEENR